MALSLEKLAKISTSDKVANYMLHVINVSTVNAECKDNFFQDLRSHGVALFLNFYRNVWRKADAPKSRTSINQSLFKIAKIGRVYRDALG